MNSNISDIRESLVSPGLLEQRQLWFASPVKCADWLLRIAVIVHAAGWAISLFARSGSAMGGVALMQWGTSDDTIFLAERIVAIVLLMAAASLIYPTLFSLGFMAAAIAIDAYTIARFGGNHYHEYALLAHSLRYLLPVALIFLTLSHRVSVEPRKGIVGAAWILRIGLSVVFFMHGLEALWHNPQFIDLIIGSMINVLGVHVGEGTALTTLTIIGTLDVAVAVLLVVWPSRMLLAWMCFWGLITALSRPFSMGIGSYTEVFIRVSHVVAPIALWLLIAYGDINTLSATKKKTSF